MHPENDPYFWRGPNPDHPVFAVGLFGERITPWRIDREDAVQDAMILGHAERSHHGTTVWWNVPAELLCARAGDVGLLAMPFLGHANRGERPAVAG